MTRESAKLSYQDQDTYLDLDLDTDSPDLLNPKIHIRKGNDKYKII